MNKKYEFTGEEKEFFGIKLKRIKTKIAFSIFAKGEVGGWIEKEENLSENGNAWVFGNAWVYDNASVSGDASVSGNIKIKTILCSRFNFDSKWKLVLWNELEKEFEKKVNEKQNEASK